MLWPIAAPLVIALRPAAPREPLAEAWARAQASPLASLLPDATTARALAGQVHAARIRLGALDGVLARPEFAPGADAQRAEALAAGGAVLAAWTARDRATTLEHLRARRDQLARALAELGLLIAQLASQAALAEVDPGVARRSGELIHALVAAVEQLARADDAEYPAAAGRS